MAKNKGLIYGVSYINGKLVATIFPSVEDVPRNYDVVHEEDLADFMEQHYRTIKR